MVCQAICDAEPKFPDARGPSTPCEPRLALRLGWHGRNGIMLEVKGDAGGRMCCGELYPAGTGTGTAVVFCFTAISMKANAARLSALSLRKTSARSR